MAIQNVADLVARSTTSSPTVTSGQYRQERENVMASIGLEKAKPPVAAVSANPPKMYAEHAQTSTPEVKPQGQGQSPFSGSNIAPPRTDYATGISDAERSRTGMGAQVTAESRTNDVLGLVRQGLSNPQELQRYLNVNQAGGVASGYTEAEIARIIQENQKAVQEGQQYRQQAIAGGATPQTLEQQALQAVKAAEDERKMSFNRQQEYLNRQFQSAYNTRELAQKSEAGQSNLRLARMGAFEAKSGESYEASLNTRHKSELFDIETKRMAALNAAQNSYDKDSLEIAYKKLEEVRALGDQMIKKDAENRAKEKEAREIEKYQKDDASEFFKGIVSAGKEFDDIPDDYLALKYPKLDKAAARALFSIHADERNVKALDEEIKAMTLEEKKLAKADRPLDRQKKLMDIQTAAQTYARNTLSQIDSLRTTMEKWPKGVPLPIGDATFLGIEGGAIFEASGDGTGRLLYKDENGKDAVRNMEFMGDPADMVTVYQNGVPVLVNKKTGLQAPITRGVPGQQSDAASKWEKFFPTGTTVGQCGEFVHRLVSNYPYGANYINEKKALKNVDKTEMPRVGDVVIQDVNTDYGHVAVVNWVGQGANGEPLMTLTESNYGIGNKEKVTHTRPLSASDSTIYGYFRGTLRPGFEFGTDVPRQEAAPTTSTAPTGAPTAAPASENLTFSSSPFTRGNLSEAQFNAANEKEQSAREAAMLVADKTATLEDATKGLSAPVKNRALRILAENKIDTAPTAPGLTTQPFETWMKENEQYADTWIKPGKTMLESAKEQYAEYEKQQDSVKTVVKAISRGKHTKEERAMFIEQANDALQSGDLASLEDLALQTARKNMSDGERGKMDTSRNLVDSYGEARAKLESFASDPDFASGNLKRIFEKAKKKGSFSSDARYTTLEYLLSTFQNEYKNKITGASLTPQEQELAEKYTISMDFDTPKDAWDKLSQGAKVHQFIADVYVASALGTPRPKLSDYLNANK